MFTMDTAPTNGSEITLRANLAPFDMTIFDARGHYDARQGWVVKRDLIGQDGFELLGVNALSWRPQ
jgi:hypothetical protein